MANKDYQQNRKNYSIHKETSHLLRELGLQMDKDSEHKIYLKDILEKAIQAIDENDEVYSEVLRLIEKHKNG